MNKLAVPFLVILLIVSMTSKVFPQTWGGRFTLGGYTSTERFTDTGSSGSTSNDFQTLSARFYLKGENLGTGDWETVLDLRDKHDFFDKLDREKLSLESRNEFQLRQLSLRYSNPKKFWGFQLGRFSISEAGSIYVDGIQIENHWTAFLTSSFFGGLHPQKRAHSYLSFDPKAEIYGTSLTYFDRRGGWNKNFYITHGVVSEIYDGHTDRNFIFQNLIYQWNEESRFITLIYYDLVPRGYVQNGILSWQQGWSKYFISDLSHNSVDVIEYSRRQGVLEKLPSSPYAESSLRLTYRMNSKQDRLYIYATDGIRTIDNLNRESLELGFIKSRIWGPNWDFYIAGGTRKNFTSKDTLAKLGLGYFSRRWEFNLDFESQIQDNDNGTKTHPLIIDTTLSYLLSRKTFLAFSAQSASDESVKILSGFFKLGYRFGKREIPPLRDGAPPRGML